MKINKIILTTVFTFIILIAVVSHFLNIITINKEAIIPLAIIILVFYVGLTLFTSLFISKPLKKLTENIDEITKGNIEINLGKSNIYEIQNLTESLNRILASLKLAILRTGATKAELGLAEAIKAKEEAEKRAEKYLEIAGAIILSLDKEGNIVLLNRKGYEILGYEKGELEGKNWFKTCIPKREQKEVKAVFDKMISGKSESAEHYENPIVRKDGKERLIRWQNTLIKDEKGRITGILSSGEDITEEHKIEEKVKEAEQRYRTMTENILEGVIILDFGGKILFANKAAANLIGLKNPEKVIGVNALKFVEPSFRKKVIIDLIKVKAGKGGFFVEYIIQRVDGEKRWVESLGRDITYEGKHVSLTVLRDITEKKKKEEALRSSTEFIRDVLEHGGNPIIAFNRKGELIIANRELLNTTGYKKEEINTREKWIRNAYPVKDVYERMKSATIEVYKGGEIDDFVIPIRCKDGNTVLVVANITGIKDANNKVIADVAFMRDLSEIFNLEDQMRYWAANGFVQMHNLEKKSKKIKSKELR